MFQAELSPLTLQIKSDISFMLIVFTMSMSLDRQTVKSYLYAVFITTHLMTDKFQLID